MIFISQNYAKGDIKRTKKVYLTSVLTVLILRELSGFIVLLYRYLSGLIVFVFPCFFLTSLYSSHSTFLNYQNANGNSTSSPTEKTDSPDISVILKLAPSHPLILIMPFTLPSSDVKSSSPFPLSTKFPSISPSL